MKILATAVAAPTHKTTSQELDSLLGLKPGTVARHGGVRTRYLAPATVLQSDLAAQALVAAAAKAHIKLASIDLLISASALPEQALPNTAAAILRQLKLSAIASFDVNSSCLSFMSALNIAASLLKTEAYNRIAIVSADLASRGLNWANPEASYIFGDGAAAVILDKAGPSTVDAFVHETYPEGFNHCQIEAGGSRLSANAQVADMKFRMDGKSVFKLAAKVVPSVVAKTLAMAGVTLNDIDVFVPHQASHLSIQHMQKRLGLPTEKTINIYADHGNQVAASLPTALNAAYERGLVPEGSRVMLLGTAAGFSAACMVVTV